MFGLYDPEGILRFSCNDREACIAYAELLNLHKDEYSLMDLPEINSDEARERQKRRFHRQARSSN